MILFLDMEFNGLTSNTYPISIALTNLSGSANLYAEFQIPPDYPSLVDWVTAHVRPYLLFNESKKFKIASQNTGHTVSTKCSPTQFVSIFDYWKSIIAKDETIEIWADCYAYDWVLFRNLFGDTEPPSVSYIPRDLSTFFDILGHDPDISREEFLGSDMLDLCMTEINAIFEKQNITITPKHNALWDAIVIRECYKKLMAEKNERINRR